MTARLRGLTWDHPRGYKALERLACEQDGPRAGDGPKVTWYRQSLADFEAKPLRSIADDYDVVVLDHPGLGEAVADQCLVPMEEVLPKAELQPLCLAAVGRSSLSYNLGGRQWAVAVDAAAQVSVVRPDLVERRPADWDAAVSLSSTVPTALCLGGPHAFLMFLAICLAFGAALAKGEDAVVAQADGLEALAIMKGLLARSVVGATTLTPIVLLDQMAHDDEVGYCPLVYGYLPYQLEHDGACRLEFFDAPAHEDGAPPASVLGGAGLAVTRSCADLTAAGQLVRDICSEHMQRDVYLEEGAQSSLAGVWGDPDIGVATGGFYPATRRTVENAWVRPRFDGYPSFQAEASTAIRSFLFTGQPPKETLALIDDLYRVALSKSRVKE